MKIQGSKKENETLHNISEEWIRRAFKWFIRICYECKTNPVEHECKADFI